MGALDPGLVALAEKASAGENCPPVTLALVSGGLAVGIPSQGDVFGEDALKAVKQATWDATLLDGRKRRREEERVEMLHEATAGLNDTFSELSAASQQPGPVLTIAPCRLVLATGDGFDIPVARVAISAVVGWWVGPTATTFGSGGSGGMVFGVGGLFNLGD